MNRKSPAFWALAVTLLFLAFTSGFFVGKSRAPGIVIASPATPDLSDINPVYTPPPDTPAPNPNPTAAAAPTPATSSDADSGDTPQAPAPGNYIDGKLNINAATLDELVTLPGIGETLAKRIIDYRSSHGDFAKISDVTKVSGIGAAKYEAIQELITVN